MTELSQGARDVLINAEHRPGGARGICAPGRDAEIEEELRALGLLSKRGFLTRKGAAMGGKLHEEYFFSGHLNQ